MYISPELHEAICNAILWGIGLSMGGISFAYAFPWIWRKTRFQRRCIKLWWEYKRDIRRYKAAMKVFDKPVRWSEK